MTAVPTSTSTWSSPTAARSTRPRTAATQQRRSRCGPAFLKTVPRTEILDRLIKPINPDAVLRESFILVPGAPGYDVVSEANGMGAFDQVDIPGAQKLLADAGVTGPIDVRLLYAANNPRRANEYDLMKASALKAGFNLIDGQSPSWGTLLPVDRRV